MQKFQPSLNARSILSSILISYSSGVSGGCAGGAGGCVDAEDGSGSVFTFTATRRVIFVLLVAGRFKICSGGAAAGRIKTGSSGAAICARFHTLDGWAVCFTTGSAGGSICALIFALDGRLRLGLLNPEYRGEPSITYTVRFHPGARVCGNGYWHQRFPRLP